MHAPTALRNRPLPYDAREGFQPQVAVRERERERGLLCYLRPRHRDMQEVERDKRGDVDFELADHCGCKGRVVEGAHELKCGVKH